MLPLLLSLTAPGLAEEPLPEPIAVVAAVPGPPVVSPVVGLPTEGMVADRLLGEPQVGTALPLSSPASTPWWMWPLGLLGAVGVAGLMVQNSRRSGGISSDVLVLSRTAVSRNATLAVIEVSDAQGATRRMLIGIGGGAPRMVADLSGEPVAQSVAEVALSEEQPAVTEAELTETWSQATSRSRSRSRPLQPPKNPALVDDEEDAPRRRGLAAYTSQGADTPVKARKVNRKKSTKTDLISEVLASRDEAPAKAEQSGASGEDSWQDPWARNFASFLGQPSHQGK
jgi:hypothetical protein